MVAVAFVQAVVTPTREAVLEKLVADMAVPPSLGQRIHTFGGQEHQSVARVTYSVAENAYWVYLGNQVAANEADGDALMAAAATAGWTANKWGLLGTKPVTTKAFQVPALPAIPAPVVTPVAAPVPVPVPVV